MRFGFGLRDAEDLFRRFFGGRDPFSDFFGDHFLETREPFQSRPMLPITDEFVRGGGRGYMQQQQSSFQSGGPKITINTNTQIEDGKRTTRTERTTTETDGKSQTQVIEETDDGRGNRTSNSFMLEDGKKVKQLKN